MHKMRTRTSVERSTIGDNVKFLISVKGDTNDGDYVTQETETDIDGLDLVKRIAAAISSTKERHNWNLSEWKSYDEEDPFDLYKGILSFDDIDLFNDTFVPHPDGGIHTICVIKWQPANQWKYLFNK